MSIQTGPFPPSTQASKVISNISIEGTRRALLKFTDGTYCQLDGWALDRVLEASAPKVDSKTPDAVSPAPPSPVDNPFSKVLRDATTSAIAAVIQGQEAATLSDLSLNSPGSWFRKISEPKSEDRPLPAPEYPASVTFGNLLHVEDRPVPPVPHVGWRERHERNAAKSVAEKPAPKSLTWDTILLWRQEYTDFSYEITGDWAPFLLDKIERYFEPASMTRIRERNAAKSPAPKLVTPADVEKWVTGALEFDKLVSKVSDALLPVTKVLMTPKKPTSLSSALVEEWRQEWRELVRGVDPDIFSDWTQFLTRQVETYFADPRSSKSKPGSSSTTGDVVYHKEVTPDGRIVDALPLQTGSQTQHFVCGRNSIVNSAFQISEDDSTRPDRSLEFRVSSLENRIPFILKTASEFGDLRKRLDKLESFGVEQMPAVIDLVHTLAQKVSKLESKSEPTFHFFDVVAGQPEVTLTVPQTIKRLHRMIGEVHDRITKLESK